MNYSYVLSSLTIIWPRPLYNYGFAVDGLSLVYYKRAFSSYINNGLTLYVHNGLSLHLNDGLPLPCQ